MSNFLTNLFPGFKTILAALGLVGAGLVAISNGDVLAGWNSLMLGLAALGIRFSK